MIAGKMCSHLDQSSVLIRIPSKWCQGMKQGCPEAKENCKKDIEGTEKSAF